MTAQRTISEEVSCHGVGLHSGEEVALRLCPAPANTGAVFRTPVEGRQVEIPAQLASIEGAANATTLAAAGGRVSTVEHLLAALQGLGIDNIFMDVAGGEVPVMDGSAAAFAELLKRAGATEQGARRGTLRLLEPVEVSGDQCVARLEPAEQFGVHYRIDFDHPSIGHQEYCADVLDAQRFSAELAAARTFGFLRDVERLWKAGLAQGGSLENTLVLDDDRVLNADGLRWPDEFVRHKVVDLLGDLSLLGVRIKARAVVERGGHALHHALAKKLVASPGAWEFHGEAVGSRPGWLAPGSGSA